MSCFENIEYKEDDFLLLNPLTIESDLINLLKDELEPNLPKLDTPLVDINCDYFKIKNNLSELKTQFLKSEARKNLGIDNSLSSISKVTYSELVALRDNASLVAGMKYRITDYVTTTKQKNTKSANHPFDIIVEAVSLNKLSELAQAIEHEGDAYFDGNDLSAWQLWYDLDNDTTKYGWADTENGKGVIYRMIDEKRNDCPYDFKNILFYKTNYTFNLTSDKYYYTFSYVVAGILYDGTVEKMVTYCYNNSMGIVHNKSLNRNVFRNIDFKDSCESNKFGNDCYNNTFGRKCYSNTFGDDCYNNILGERCHLNTFGDRCYSYKFGNDCYNNTFGNICDGNRFGNNCHNNTFGNNCFSNTFGNDCYNNTFEGSFVYNTFGNDCYFNTFEGKCINNTFEAGLQYRTLNSDKTSITLNEEYYDDGTNALVPIKHPDLSTQPSILPYKFMGQYVYEQLIPVDSLVQDGGSFFIPKDFFLSKEIFVFDCAFVGFGYFLRGEVVPVSPQTSYFGDGYRVTGSSGANDSVRYKYIKIVYTSMPEEGGYYYNSAIQKGILVKVSSGITPLAMYNGTTFLEPIEQGQDYYFDIPNDYISSEVSIGINSQSESIIVHFSIPDIGKSGILEYDNSIKQIKLPDELVDKAKQYLVIITIG